MVVESGGLPNEMGSGSSYRKVNLGASFVGLGCFLLGLVSSHGSLFVFCREDYTRYAYGGTRLVEPASRRSSGCCSLAPAAPSPVAVGVHPSPWASSM